MEDSFNYRNNLQCSGLYECIVTLDGVYAYIASIGERLYFDWECIASQEVVDGITLADWLWSGLSDRKENPHRAMLLEILMKPTARENKCDRDINICLYPRKGSVSTKEQYVNQRRSILTEIKDSDKFCDFMYSCFTTHLASLYNVGGWKWQK
jgi:hypothetical protein